jgi:hypothetical protein
MRSLRVLVVAGLVFWCAGAFGGPVVIVGVPDWDQPVKAGPPPNLGAGWNAWCVPTAAADIMGYYRDKGTTNLIADALVFPNKNGWAGPPKAADYQDDTADPRSADPPLFGVVRGDIGWYMNTNDLGQTATLPAGGTYAGTKNADIKAGLDGSKAGFTGYFPGSGLNNVTVRNAAANALLNTVPGGPFTVATVWNRILTEINAGRPVLISFTHGAFINRIQVRGGGPAGLPDYDLARWASSNPGGDTSVGEIWDDDLGHTMTLVGYWDNDATNPFYDCQTLRAPKAIIVYDNRDGFLNNPARPLPLVLPFDGTAPWLMNTEILIPEPATMLLLASGGALLVLRRRRR